ncbi:dihydrofolate reductase family protein [Kitasatospora sp. NBC_01539]|uniref:dihydrofolate reductase family protein n=1 Tax=Kitasatospora sp. NBC_01539 TaxID=2903577 RepID=UPI0038601E43
MARVVTQASMSLDGFVADTADRVGPLFDWYGNGDTAFTGADPERVFHVSAASAAYLRTAWSGIRACVIGRRLFDLTNGWNGRPAVGEHVFVVTHRPPTGWDFPDAPFTFVTGGVAEAVARAAEYAGDGDVSVTPGDVGGQAFAAGLVDEVRIDLVPVVFGAGVRYFGALTGAPLLLDDPDVVQGDRVTHLHHRVRRT